MTLSIIIPALNEQDHIISALDKANQLGADEIICVDGMSQDNTEYLMQLWGNQHPEVKYCILQKKTKGIGDAFREGLYEASGEYVMVFAGDGEENLESTQELIKHIGEKDLILAYPSNQEIRPWHRQLLSKTYIAGLNLMCGLNLHYYTGTNIFKTKIIRGVNFSDDFTYTPFLVMYCIKYAKCSYIEIPVKKEVGGKTKIFRLLNIWKCFWSTIFLVLYAWIG